ncbi:DNA repair protein RadC [Pseudomonas graminis]|uniref:DNA repair protein RadC n=1 Tax=Pseudomonas graminis TaxID=158627 RepID=A0A1I0JC45_9PSED|nr:DNA repair protein RadC [Pseudomonas graminis]
MVVCHNHPSGVKDASEADIDLTRHLKQALALVDVVVLDHLIIGDGDPLSMVEYGLM